MSSLERRVGGLKDKMASLVEENFESELFTTKLDLLDHLCDDLGNFWRILFLDAASYENFYSNIEVLNNYRCADI